MKSLYKRYRKFISLATVLIIGVLFAKSLKNNWDKLGSIDVTPDGFIVVAIGLFILSVALTGLFWGRIIQKLTGEHFSKKELIRVQFMSWLMKYIPGQVGSFLGKYSWAKDKSVDGKKITTSFIYENVFLLVASVIVSIPPLFIALGRRVSDSSSMVIPILVAVPLAIILMKPSIFQRIINLMFNLLNKGTLTKDNLLSYRDTVRYSFEFTIPRIVNGLGFVMIAISVIGINPGLYLTFGAIYVLAGVIGIMAIFTPSGLGVRELVIVVLASNYIPTEQAVALSLLARFYSTVSDIGIAGIYLYLKKGQKAK